MAGGLNENQISIITHFLFELQFSINGYRNIQSAQTYIRELENTVTSTLTSNYQSMLDKPRVWNLNEI